MVEKKILRPATTICQTQAVIDLGGDYGAAVILEGIARGVMRHAADGTHEHDGRFWMYQTCKGMAEYYGTMSEDTVFRKVKKLIREDMIVQGCFNKVGFDRTSWYTLTERGYSYYQTPEPLPKATTDEKRQTKESARKRKQAESGKLVDAVPADVQEIVDRWHAAGLPKIVKITRARVDFLTQAIETYGKEDLGRAIDFWANDDFYSKADWFSLSWVMSRETDPVSKSGVPAIAAAIEAADKDSKRNTDTPTRPTDKDPDKVTEVTAQRIRETLERLHILDDGEFFPDRWEAQQDHPDIAPYKTYITRTYCTTTDKQ